MKTFRIIGMTILLVVVCETFLACGSNDDDNDVFNAKEASLVIGKWWPSDRGFNDDYIIFDLDGTYKTSCHGSGNYLVNNKKGIIKLYNRIYEDYYYEHLADKEEKNILYNVYIKDVKLRFFMSDNDHMRLEWIRWIRSEEKYVSEFNNGSVLI